MTHDDRRQNASDTLILVSLLSELQSKQADLVTNTVIPNVSEDAEKWDAFSESLKQASYIAYRIRRRCLGLQA